VNLVLAGKTALAENPLGAVEASESEKGELARNAVEHEKMLVD
jgi:hypothetical protein